jgi:peptide deformylase
VSVRPILTAPDPVLAGLAAPVTDFGPALEALVRDMFDTMYAAPGRGLAAPQVGVALRLFVMDTGWKDGAPDPRVFINPRIIAASDTMVALTEGCLSLPDQPRRVARPAEVALEWQGLDRAPATGTFNGFAAACVQHERDHLDGILITDHPEVAE